MTRKPNDHVTPPPPVRRWPRLVLLLLIFVCGGVVGAVSGSAWMRNHMIAMMRNPEQVPDRIMPQIRSKLALSEDQTKKVDEIVRRRHALMESLRAETYPRQMAEFEAMQAEVAEILTLEQRSNWSALCDSVEQRYLPVRPVGPPPADVLFYRFDANNDGALSEDEVPPGMWQRLSLADNDSDGQVTRLEYLNTLP